MDSMRIRSCARRLPAASLSSMRQGRRHQDTLLGLVPCDFRPPLAAQACSTLWTRITLSRHVLSNLMFPGPNNSPRVISGTSLREQAASLAGFFSFGGCCLHGSEGPSKSMFAGEGRYQKFRYVLRAVETEGSSSHP